MNKTILYTNATQKPAKLFIVDNAGNTSEFLLKDRNILGSNSNESNADIRINSGIVSARHGEFAFHDGECFYRDLNSDAGTYINNKLYGKNSGKQRAACRLENGDILRIGSHTASDAVVMIFSTDYEDDAKWQTQELNSGISEINIGRNAEALANGQNIKIDNNMVSKKHASFFKAQLGWAVADHNSTNGVFVTGKIITESVYLQCYDVIKIVNLFFVFLGDKLIYQKPAAKEADSKLFIQINERSVWQNFKKHTLLKNINITINKSEMVMILGGSGAGKTTFMNAVMGYEKADGKIIHGKTDIYNDYEAMKYEIGYVPQQDLLRENDTVFQTLNDAAKLKLPKKTSEEQRVQRIGEVMNILGLQRERSSLVSKLSGGQRKRLSIAVEYIANPGLFFLDEPDSGLDGIMAKNLNENLRSIADTGKIIMIITHSPDRVSQFYDKVIVLAKSADANTGQLAFFGTVKEALAFFDVDSLESVVKRINRPDEGGEGKSDFYINKYKTRAG